jgi:hypothetical protein
MTRRATVLPVRTVALGVSDLFPVPVDDAVREGLAGVDAAELTVCLFDSHVAVVADESLSRGVAVAAETLAAHADGPVDVAIAVAGETIEIRVTPSEPVEPGSLAEATRLDYVHRLLERYGGSGEVTETGVVLRLRRA